MDLKKEGIDKTILAQAMERSHQDVRKFFNTSGKLYRELHLKDKVAGFDIQEAAELIAAHPMLLKRPLVLCGEKVVIGYAPEAYESCL